MLEDQRRQNVLASLRGEENDHLKKEVLRLKIELAESYQQLEERAGAREMLEAQQERHATLSKTLDEHVKGKTMAEEEIKHLRQKLSERDQDIDRADSMLRMMRQRELDRERERERERVR
eukprot:Tamp_29361.p2 GENE.Tamp_29361~~Tamp_29361.p2  ORF type:complete len:120 (+),score=40.44 Tamp_29361:2-361(+)